MSLFSPLDHAAMPDFLETQTTYDVSETISKRASVVIRKPKTRGANINLVVVTVDQM